MLSTETLRSPMPTRFERVQPWISTVCRLVLAAVWLVAGGLKVGSVQQSVQAVHAYELPLPDSLITFIGWGMPWFEVALGLLLLAGLLTRPAAIVSAITLTIFMIAVASAWARGLTIDCGCFGGGGQVAPGEAQYISELLRDTGLLLIAGWLIWRPRSLFSLDRVADDEENS